MELKDYTIEELKAEIKRRKKEERANRPKPEPQFVYAKATVTEVRGRTFTNAEYYVDVDPEYLEQMSGVARRELKNNNVKLIRAKFSKKTAPKEGDRVLIKSKITQDNPTGWGTWFKPYICEVLGE